MLRKKKSEITHCGYVAIVGRPNVGKSTLLNYILGQKLSIVSSKPQTTRHQILGIKTTDQVQTIYVDTPGLHQNNKRAMNKYLNRAATAMLHDVNVVVFVVEAMQWYDEDAWILKKLEQQVTCPIILVINKVDEIRDKMKLLPFIEQLSEKYKFTAILPVSAKDGDQVEKLEETVTSYLPESPFIFPEDQLTDRSERFLAAEIIREKIFQALEQELPYATTVTIDEFKTEERIIRIAATIWVEKPGQKAIMIGASGNQLKKIGTQARLELEEIFENKVFLQLWVKVKDNWADDERALKNLGYE